MELMSELYNRLQKSFNKNSPMRYYSDIKRVMGMLKQINRYLNEGKKEEEEIPLQCCQHISLTKKPEDQLNQDLTPPSMS